MYLLILESLGTQELILVGIIALVVFGPRRLPELARKFGSMMSEFRKVSGEFRSTWENAVDLENLDEPKKIETSVANDVTDEIENSIGQTESLTKPQENNGNAVKPEVRKVSKEEFDNLVAEKKEEANQTAEEKNVAESEKTDWL